MKLSDIVKRVQRTFGDDIEAQITVDDIVRWCNDACLDIVTSNGTNQGFLGSSEVKVGISEYALPSDLILLRSVRIAGMKLIPTTYEQLIEMDSLAGTTQGEPTHFWVYGGKLNLYPVPVNPSGIINILYVKAPDILVPDNLNAVPDVPLQYHPRIVEYCIAQAAELDDNIPHYQLKMNQFNQNVGSLKQNSEQPESDSYYPNITYVGEYDG